MIEHVITHDEPGADLMSPRARTNHETKQDDHTVLPTWLWKTLHGFMMAVTTSAVLFLFWISWTHQVDISNANAEVKITKTEISAVVEANKLVNEQQSQHLIILTQQYDRINDKLDAMRDEMRKLKSSP